MPITTNVVISNPTQARLTQYNIMWWKFFIEMRQVDSFLKVLQIPPPIKLTATI